MKFIVIGLGQFGSSLAIRLAQYGHEVIGVDKNMRKVEEIKDKISYSICLDSKELSTLESLPLENTDVVVVCIANEGDNLLTTALLKKANVKRVISRSVSSLQDNVLEAMGITEIFKPEKESAERWAFKLSTTNYINLFEVTKSYSIAEIKVPSPFIGKTVKEIGLNKKYKIILLTKLKTIETRNHLGIKTHEVMSGEAITAETVLEANDIIIIYGHIKDISKLIEHS